MEFNKTIKNNKKVNREINERIKMFQKISHNKIKLIIAEDQIKEAVILEHALELSLKYIYQLIEDKNFYKNKYEALIKK